MIEILQNMNSMKYFLRTINLVNVLFYKKQKQKNPN